MPRPIFVMDRNGAAVNVGSVPEWATHIIERKADKVLFYARNIRGTKEFFVGPTGTFEFHPEGYQVFDQFPFKNVIDPEPEPAKTSPKYYNMPAYKVGAKWWVGLPGQKHLVKASITKVGVLILGLNYHQDCYSVNRTFKFADIEMVEPEEWSE